MDTIFSLNGIDFNKLFDATIKWLLGPGIRVTRGWSQFVLDIDVSSEADLERVITTIEKVLKDYAKEFPHNVLAEPQVLGIESFGDNSVKIRSVVKTVPSKQWDAGRVIRRRIKAEFDRLGIEIPIKQRVVLLQKEDGRPVAE